MLRLVLRPLILTVALAVVAVAMPLALVAGVVRHVLRPTCPGRLAWRSQGLIVDRKYFQGGSICRRVGPGLCVFFGPRIRISVRAFPAVRTIYLAGDRYLLVGILIQGV